MSNFKGISQKSLEGFRAYYENNTVSKVATKAMAKQSVNDACYDTFAAAKMNHKFSIEIPTMKACNQKHSGRCWLFSALNVLREQLAKELNVEEIELSQNYMSFCDKIEKSNYFLESIIDTYEMPADSRLVSHLLSSPVSDGGQWDMFVGLVEKYGVMPKEAMPETFQSENTHFMNSIINTMLRKDALLLRNALNEGRSSDEAEGMKEEMLKEIYNILSICLGNPPQSFDFEYVDKDKKYHLERALTPKSFYSRFIKVDLSEFISIINAPTETKPFNRTYTVEYLKSVAEGPSVLYFNLPINRLKELVIKQLEAGELVWFGCDTGKAGEREKGIWDTGLYDYETPFGINMQMDKGDMLDYSQSAMGHAMVITGVNLVDQKPDKWKIENSWGDENGCKGYYIISDDWFDRYVYQVCINKKHLSEEERELIKQQPTVLKPWDPMGTLA